ncbi:MAG: DUF1919 domain-containing protein [Paludibacter sp.]|nr:DUF1919 domain-containing protein [Paludibacter sp.]
MAVIKRISRFVIKLLRSKFNRNKHFTIICDSCVAGVMYNELSLQFQTPTINLYIRADDFIKFVSDLRFYFDHELCQIFKENISFPVAKLADIEIYFMHYHSFEDAKVKWNERKIRVNYDNLFVIMTENEGCGLTHLKKFDQLSFKKKVVFTHKKYDEIESAYYIKGFDSDTELGNIILDSNSFGKRYYDQFSWLKWLNGK